MKPPILFIIVVFLGSESVLFSQTTSSKPGPGSSSLSSFTTECPEDSTGVLIENSGWIEVPDETPSDTKVKHGILHAFTYGAMPARAVSIYDGVHAQVQIRPSQPILCICRTPSLHSAPVLVKLHPKKDSRELDGGRLSIGAKILEATVNDLVTVDVSRPESNIWLLRPRELLLPGEYAVMLGTQDLSIFPFTVFGPANQARASRPARH